MTAECGEEGAPLPEAEKLPTRSTSCSLHLQSFCLAQSQWLSHQYGSWKFKNAANLVIWKRFPVHNECRNLVQDWSDGIVRGRLDWCVLGFIANKYRGESHMYPQRWKRRLVTWDAATWTTWRHLDLVLQKAVDLTTDVASLSPTSDIARPIRFFHPSTTYLHPPPFTLHCSSNFLLFAALPVAFDYSVREPRFGKRQGNAKFRLQVQRSIIPGSICTQVLPCGESHAQKWGQG